MSRRRLLLRKSADEIPIGINLYDFYINGYGDGYWDSSQALDQNYKNIYHSTDSYYTTNLLPYDSKYNWSVRNISVAGRCRGLGVDENQIARLFLASTDSSSIMSQIKTYEANTGIKIKYVCFTCTIANKRNVVWMRTA